MKKAYIRPESRLFAINFTENIADPSLAGGIIQGTHEIGYDLIDGKSGLFYTKCEAAPVRGGTPSEQDYDNWVSQYYYSSDLAEKLIALDLMYHCG